MNEWVPNITLQPRLVAGKLLAPGEGAFVDIAPTLTIADTGIPGGSLIRAASIEALIAGFPAGDNAGREAMVGSSLPYAFYLSDGTTWNPEVGASPGGGSPGGGSSLSAAQTALLTNQLSAPNALGSNLTIDGANVAAYHAGNIRCTAALKITIAQTALDTVPGFSVGIFLPSTGIVQIASDGNVLLQDGAVYNTTDIRTRSFAANPGGFSLIATGEAHVINVGGAGGTA